MKFNLDIYMGLFNSLINSTKVVFYFAILAGILSLAWMNTSKKYHQNHYQRLVNVGGIYIVSFVVAQFVLPRILR